jgi:hypothetical protein
MSHLEWANHGARRDGLNTKNGFYWSNEQNKRCSVHIAMCLRKTAKMDPKSIGIHISPNENRK